MNEEKLIEQGTVSKINGSTVEVIINSNNNCDECTAKIFCKPEANNQNVLTVESYAKVEVGDSVEISISGKTILSYTFFLYGFPLILLITILTFGAYLFQDIKYFELYSFSFGICILVIYYFLFNYLVKKNNTFLKHPILVKIDKLN